MPLKIFGDTVCLVLFFSVYTLLTTKTDDGAKASTTKLLAKWRPHILGEQASNGIKTEAKESSSTPAPVLISTPTPVPKPPTSPGLIAAG